MLGERSWDRNVGRRVTASSMCARKLDVCEGASVFTYRYIYMKSENLWYLFLHMCVHSFYAYVKKNKIRINKITQLDAIHAFFVQMMKNHIPTKWGLCFYRSRPTDKTHWINVNLYNTRIFCPQMNFIFFPYSFEAFLDKDQGYPPN